MTNADTSFFTFLGLTSWAERWEACKGTALENACLQSFADSSDAELACHAGCALECPEARDEAIGYIEDFLAALDAEEAFHEACYSHEAHSGHEWESSPALFDSKAWQAEYAAKLDAGHRAFVRGAA